MKVSKVAVIVRDNANCWEGLRTSLGLAIEMIETHLILLGKVSLPEERTESFEENLGFLINELEGRVFTDTKANVDEWEYFEYLSGESVAQSLDGYDLVIPF